MPSAFFHGLAGSGRRRVRPRGASSSLRSGNGKTCVFLHFSSIRWNIATDGPRKTQDHPRLSSVGPPAGWRRGGPGAGLLSHKVRNGQTHVFLWHRAIWRNVAIDGPATTSCLVVAQCGDMSTPLPCLSTTTVRRTRPLIICIRRRIAKAGRRKAELSSTGPLGAGGGE